MIDKLTGFFKRHAYETILALFILIFGGSIAGAWQLTVSAVAEYPLPFFLICTISFVAGLVVSAVRDRRSAMLAEIEAETQRIIDARDRDEKREEAERAENKRMAIVRSQFKKQVMEMGYEDKVVFAALRKSGSLTAEWNVGHYEWGAYIPQDDLNASMEILLSMSFVEFETVGDDARRWMLKPKIVNLLDELPELLEPALEDADVLLESLQKDCPERFPPSTAQREAM